MRLIDISWPVFKLGEHKPLQDSGLVFYSKEYVNEEDGTTRIGLRIVDDTNLPGDTLGSRRLHIRENKEINIFPIRAAIYFLPDLVKLAKPTTWFIDSNGKVFQYKKSSRAKLTFHKIKKITPNTGGLGGIVEVVGIPQRFKCIFIPKDGREYVGILRYGLGYMLYGFYHEELPASYRSV